MEKKYTLTKEEMTMEPTPAGTTGQKIASLQGLRAIALSGIILYHYGNPNLDLTAAWSVSLFFMLSGYLNGLLWEKGKRPEKDLKSSILYMIRHIKKLYFLHVIITFLSIPISDAIPSIQTEGISKLPFWSVIFFMNLTLTKSLYPKYYWGFNGVSWFLSSYAVLCLLTPLLLHGTAHMLKKKRPGAALKIMLLLLAATFAYCLLMGRLPVNLEYWIYIFPLARLGEYLTGIIAGMYISRLPQISFSWMEPIAALLLIAFMFWIPLPQWLCRSVIWMIPNVLLLWSFHRTQGPLSRLASTKPFVILGDLSGYMFLIHQTVYTYFLHFDFLNRFFSEGAGIAVFSYLLTVVLAAGFSCLDRKRYLLRN